MNVNTEVEALLGESIVVKSMLSALIATHPNKAALRAAFDLVGESLIAQSLGQAGITDQTINSAQAMKEILLQQLPSPKRD